MTNNVLLNNVEHKDLKIIMERGAQFGDNVWYTIAFPFEFRNLNAHYPIFFQRDGASGKIFPIVLFGFENGENLFLEGASWDAHYIPLGIKRHPFSIGKQIVNENGEEFEKRVVSIDLDSPRVSSTEGEPLFLELGGPSDILDNYSEMLETIHNGMEQIDTFIAMLEKYELLEPFSMEVALDDQSKNQLIGFYAINEEKLSALNLESLGELNTSGCLQSAYMTIASQSNVQDLVERKNKKRK